MTYIHTYIHKYIYIHTYIHTTYIYTYIHTYIYTYNIIILCTGLIVITLIVLYHECNFPLTTHSFIVNTFVDSVVQVLLHPSIHTSTQSH